jgi:protein-S-isoprenylcysteine O-methyltransferase Ste14
VFVLARALTYAALFIGFFLVFVPAGLLARAGIDAPRDGALLAVGAALAAAGGALAVWCVVTFALAGKGTPAPFDPPRRLVARGPYRFLRNPMYLGADAALLGAALVYRSLALAAYAAGFLLVVHLFVLWYEEPTLRAAFGEDYDAYCRDVHRWFPRWRPTPPARG